VITLLQVQDILLPFFNRTGATTAVQKVATISHLPPNDKESKTRHVSDSSIVSTNKSGYLIFTIGSSCRACKFPVAFMKLCVDAVPTRW